MDVNVKPNSYKYKEKMKQEGGAEKPKVEKVISGNATVKKKGAARKFTDVFISEDASNVKSYLFSDVLVPAAKKLISDIVKDGIEMLLYGSTGNRNRSSSGVSGNYVSYNRFSDRDRRNDVRPRTVYNYNDITLDNRGDAEAVLDTMTEILDTYRMVSIADLYEAVGIPGRYTDNKYGWTDLSTARVVRVRDGFMIDLPRAIPLD